MKLTASTRTRVAGDHALIAPDGWVNSTLPGWSKCNVYIIISPAMGAGFAQWLVLMEQGGLGKFEENQWEHFVYVMEGSGTLTLQEQKHSLTTGSFAFIPAGQASEIEADEGLKLTIFQKHYQPLEGVEAPQKIVNHIDQVPSELYLQDPQLHMQYLLPDDLSFDMGVNIFTYDPGGNLPFVETHVMEHGLIYLSGQGIYRLADRWYPVTKDDCIWMAPYCPQWFVAMGKEPAVYLYYKNINRMPLDQ